MKYVITGGTGFIGRALIGLLSVEPCEIVVLTRRPITEKSLGKACVRFVLWDARTAGDWVREVDASDAVINLAGKSLFSARWTTRVKRELTASRVCATDALVRAMQHAGKPPTVFISASAVGYYGDCGEDEISEHAPPGSGFLCELTARWEAVAAAASSLGVRVVLPRIGIVFGSSGGALQKMAMPFYCMVGGSIGSGNQFIPWIHIDDLVRALVYPIGQKAILGPYNCSASTPVTMKYFCASLGRVLHRPNWTRVPNVVLKAVLGEAASTLLTGQKAIPEKLCAAGFKFHYTNVDDALYSIYNK